MTASTEVSLFQEASQAGNPIVRRQGKPSSHRPIRRRETKTTVAGDQEQTQNVQSSTRGELPRWSAPMARAALPQDIVSNSTPLQIWEGTVISVDRKQNAMRVLLDAKIGQIPRHTAEIDLQWVSEQDQDLLRPGAVFYLTLFKRTKPTVENSQELRFRRRPSWSATQLKKIDEDATAILSKMKVLPSAE